jgi:hypothetical protein
MSDTLVSVLERLEALEAQVAAALNPAPKPQRARPVQSAPGYLTLADEGLPSNPDTDRRSGHGNHTSRGGEGEPDRRLAARAVAERYNVCIRSIDRWLLNPKLNFPRPASVVNRRRYWSERVRRWDLAQIVRSASNVARLDEKTPEP